MGKYSTTKAPWRSILKNLSWFKDNQGWEINNGDQISFWHSNWSQEGILSLKYPWLFSLFQTKNLSVKEVWAEIKRCWNINPRRSMNKRENNLWLKITKNLPIPRVDNSSSKPTLKLESNKMFSKASAKRSISHMNWQNS